MAAGLAVPHGQTRDPDLVGRDAEVAEIGAFLAATAGAPSALVIVGDVGIGKTAVWKHAIRSAARTHRVLSCRPARAEAPLAFAALDDLFGAVLGEILPGLPEPRPRVLARAVLDGLRILSRDTPVLLAVDDAQWLDRPSAEALEFCIRRLDQAAVTILLTLRGEDPVFARAGAGALPGLPGVRAT